MKGLLILILISLATTARSQEIVWDTTFTTDNLQFKVLACRTDTGDCAQIIKLNRDTITIMGVGGGVEVVNFNNDRYPDVTLSYLGNKYVADLYLYDKTTKFYKQVDGFNEVSDARPLKVDSNYYYSYSRAGCADMNWVSYLFYIKNFKVYQIGQIDGKGCDGMDTERVIEVLKIVTLDKIYLLESFPIDIVEAYKDYKWGFIEDYWNKNLNKFKNKNAP